MQVWDVYTFTRFGKLRGNEQNQYGFNAARNFCKSKSVLSIA